jgi:hypothetical protein
MIGFDLTVLGTCLGFLGSIILARSYLTPAFAKQATQAFFGQNPFLVRNQIVQRVEALAGTFWLVFGFLFGAIGTVLTSIAEEERLASDYWLHFVLTIGGTVILFVLSLRWTKYKSRQEYRPMMVHLQRELYRRCAAYLSNGGLEQHEIDRGANIPQETRDQRLLETRPKLDQLGQLLDAPRKPLELDRDYIRRLEPFFRD